MRRILLIYRAMIPSVRLCGHCQLEYLAGRGRVEYRAVQELSLTAGDMDWAEVVLLGRLDSWYEHRLVRILKKAGKRLVYVIDDDLLNIPPQIKSANYYRLVQGHIRAMIDMSDALLSPSPLLLEKYAGDRAALTIEEPALAPAAFEPRAAGGPVKIGFAGSLDRVGDVEAILKEVLPAVKRAYGERVQFEFFGAVPAFAQALDARAIPYCDSYDAYRRTLDSLRWDIGLAPMPDTPFHACKHYNKFCEYAAAGVAGVFSKVYPYTRIAAFKDSAMLCDNDPAAWLAALRRLIDDDALRERLRENASRCAHGPLSLEASAEGLLRQMEALPASNASAKVRVSPVGLSALKGGNLAVRAATKLRADGLRGSVEAVVRRLGAKLRT